jgi:hypothetical protein
MPEQEQAQMTEQQPTAAGRPIRSDRITEHCAACNRLERFWVSRRRGDAITAKCMTCGYVLVGTFKAVAA